MSSDIKTLADAQPGGRVRLGDQAERARFEQYRGGDFERDAQGYYTNPRTAQDWAMWQAALSAQPSPGGQEYAWNIAELVRADLDRQSCPDAYMRIAMESVVKHVAARQPSKQPDSVALGEATEFCIENGARQPVGQKAVVTSHWRDGELNHILYCSPMPDGVHRLYAAPPAQAVDLGQEHVATLTVDDDGMLGWKLTHIGRDLPEGEYRLALIDSRDPRHG
ncbi:hypothetical protein K1516_16830 [Stenotrophomonas maltophilia]|uniref:hypothetical protein n=1 Tax=Stenotrophomonas maltophilia TaxID=40324 RepID=UPI002010519E|nr:hypothetical protein [Stenotrophomonas maltophilia]UQA72829.1 hypothetical protein K1516_16830 [Stenotrophomonas maltophilia]